MKISNRFLYRGDNLTYEDLLKQADELGLTVKDKPLLANKGRIKKNRIAIKKDLPDIEKTCVLAEELGHYHTTVGDIIEQKSVSDVKQEQYARLWAYDKLIGLHGIIRAYKHDCCSLHDMADFLEVTEEFLSDALERYRSKYGCYTVFDTYIIYFEPSLGVLEMV